jgi:hypothetical protein
MRENLRQFERDVFYCIPLQYSLPLSQKNTSLTFSIHIHEAKLRQLRRYRFGIFSFLVYQKYLLAFISE